MKNENEERGIGPHGQKQGCAGQFFLLHYYCFIILSSSLNRHNFFIFLCQKFFNLRDIFIVYFLKFGFRILLLVFGHTLFNGLFSVSIASRRALRILTFAVSPSPLHCLASCLRRSSVNGGIPKRIISPLFSGVMPKSESMIAFR